MPDHIHAKAKQRAAELGISFAEFARRLFERELDEAAPRGDIDAICGMVSGAPFDMAQDGKKVIVEAANRQLADKTS